MAHPQPSETVPNSLPTPLRERAGLALVALTLVMLGGGFWYANGARTFGELMLGAFSWCF